MRKGIVFGALLGGLTLGPAAAYADLVEVDDGAELAAAIVQANSDASVTKIRCTSNAGCDV
ncbi:MAG TPA: hypothetical protein VKN76_01885, partial [Kiloniellaceae bacterium]|nr:hypothetical protein [Kiloniellaceae bacterium]